MSPLHLSFCSAFVLSGLGLAFHRTHLVSALLCLESMILSIFVVPIIILTFSACEAGTLNVSCYIANTKDLQICHVFFPCKQSE
uniref:NADH dehydrogenase subunit 4L n=1 Tax=Cairina moschata TaxID=8855 RepID=A0A8C3CUI3_CAIMO